MARGALTVLRAAGVRVPEDIALVGFDDSSVAITTDPQLTTMRQPMYAQGETMAPRAAVPSRRAGSAADDDPAGPSSWSAPRLRSVLRSSGETTGAPLTPPPGQDAPVRLCCTTS